MLIGYAMTREDDEGWIEPTDPAIEESADRILAFSGAVDPQALAAIDERVQAIAWVDHPDQLEDRKLGFLLEHWQKLARACGGIPDRQDIDVLDLVPAIGNLMVLEAERDGFDAVYRVYGTGVADRAGRDWTGYRVSEMNRITRTPAALLYRTCYRAVFRRPAPLYTEHASPQWVGANSWRRLILPLSDRGLPCARFLVGNLPVGRKLMSPAEIAAQQQRIRGS
jgi:hypothetical protein